MDNLCGAVEPQDQRLVLERTKHNDHAWIMLDVGRRLVAATRYVKPRDAVATQYNKRVHTFR
jgi:hypothetical protein